MSVLEKIRQMPNNQKKVLSFAIATALTLLIVVTFFSTADKTTANQVEKEDSKLSSIKPMQLIKDEFSKAFSNFGEVKDGLESITIQSTSTTVVSEQSVPVEIVIEDLSVTGTSSDMVR